MGSLQEPFSPDGPEQAGEEVAASVHGLLQHRRAIDAKSQGPISPKPERIGIALLVVNQGHEVAEVHHLQDTFSA